MEKTIIRTTRKVVPLIKSYYLIMLFYVLISFLGLAQLVRLSGTSEMEKYVGQEHRSLNDIYRERLMKFIQ
jgi:hypothetical protein